MAHGLIGERGRVWSANHDRHAQTVEFPGEIVRMKRGRCRRGDRDQIGRDVEAHRFDDLVGVRHGVL